MSPDAHAGLKDGLVLTGCLSGVLDVQLSCQALTSVQHRAGLGCDMLHEVCVHTCCRLAPFRLHHR